MLCILSPLLPSGHSVQTGFSGPSGWSETKWQGLPSGQGHGLQSLGVPFKAFP